MKKEYLLETVRGQTRLAVIEDGALCELYYERPGSEKLSGNLYLGRVQNILPGMNAAFVDIGQEKNAFLYAGDIPVDTREEQELASRMKEARIEKMIRPGQEILVQVIKEPGGTKGCRISSHVTVPGRMTVLLPSVSYVGISKKIEDPAERSRLHAIASGLIGDSGMGVIVRTAAEGADEEALRADYHSACELWKAISQKAKFVKAPKLIHSDGSLALRVVRDMLDETADSVRVDDHALFEEVSRYAQMLAPEYADRISEHKGSTPLFDIHRVDVQADKRMGRHVWLKSGGSLVIDETEALTVIDVNTGKFVGNKSFDETVFRLNCEAAQEIARLLRLRDIGGIIVIDFIDMDVPEHREQLLSLLRELMAGDRNRTNVVGFTGLGLVEMTRKKVRRPVTKQLMHICSDCGGRGMVPSYETTARRIVRELWVRARQGEEGTYLVEAIEPVAGWLSTIGSPEGMRVYARVNPELKADEYTISPVGEKDLPAGSKLLK
ncbi:MAG: Rne/Rng family ribonuclease [Clostridia bacterium]|nr:Rne/Rng family ribonuclease [Clostridia bacterium]